MKKKILSLLMVFAFGFTIAGCDATMEDVKNQASKMQEIIDEGKLFEDDWALIATTSEDDESVSATVKKDGDNYYIKYAMGEEIQELIMIKDSSTYTVYDTQEKKYTIIGATEVENSFNVDALMTTYDSYLEALKGMEEGCGKDGVTCELEKNLFGKLTITISKDDTDDYLTMVIRKGKLLELGGVMDGVSLNYEFDYGNQKIEAPENKSEYTYMPA
jgi:hypothetical protein